LNHKALESKEATVNTSCEKTDFLDSEQKKRSKSCNYLDNAVEWAALVSEAMNASGQLQKVLGSLGDILTTSKRNNETSAKSGFLPTLSALPLFSFNLCLVFFFYPTDA